VIVYKYETRMSGKLYKKDRLEMAKKLWMVIAFVVSLGALTSCLFPRSSEISVADLEQQIAIKMSTNNNANNVIRLNAVTCYDPLPATAGAQSRCSVSDAGVTFWVTAVSKGEVDGASDFDIVYDNQSSGS